MGLTGSMQSNFGSILIDQKLIIILDLQEVKADPFRLDVALRVILPNFTHLSSPPDGGRGGTAILISPRIRVLSSGWLDFGRAVWFQASLEKFRFGLICVYAPNSPRERALLWEELKSVLPLDNWIMCEDFNMTEDRQDSYIGPLSSLIRQGG